MNLRDALAPVVPLMSTFRQKIERHLPFGVHTGTFHMGTQKDISAWTLDSLAHSEVGQGRVGWGWGAVESVPSNRVRFLLAWGGWGYVCAYWQSAVWSC